MTLRTRIPLLFVLVLLTATVSAAAWHQEDERENAKYGAVGGDPRVMEDMGPCREKTRNETQVTCAVLYGHILDHLNLIPLNTQIPADCAPDLAAGLTGAPNVEPHWAFTRNSLYSNGGFVEYGPSCREAPRAHWERGLADELQISDADSIRLHWYLSADMIEFSPLGIGTGADSPLPGLGAMPCLTVRAVLETGRWSGSGEVITEGETTKTVLSTPDGQGQTEPPLEDPCPGSKGTIKGEEVTEFIVELPPVTQEFGRGDVFTFGVHWYQHNGTSGDPAEEDNIAQNHWNHRTGSEYRNRIVMPVERPLRVIDLQVYETPGDTLLNQIILRSPWGAYDVDEQNIRFEVVHADGTVTPVHHDPFPTEGGYHGHHSPRNLTYDWDPQTHGLEPGEYTLRAIAPNWQHTAQAQTETMFIIDEDDEVQTALLPGPGIVPVLLLLGLLVGLAKGPRSRRGSSR